MQKNYSIWLGLLVAAMLWATPAQAQTPLSRILKVKNANSVKVVGYGLVVGLDRTGDRTISRRGAQFTVHSIANMLDNFGISVDPQRLRTRNVAAVIVTAEIGPYNAQGSEIDVTVSSMGDASSLKGGVLLETPLLNPDTKEIYALAQGPLVVGGINKELGGASVSRNASLTARIPGGGTVKHDNNFRVSTGQPLQLVLNKPGYTNARNVAKAINDNFDEKLASVYNPGIIQVEWPQAFKKQGMRNMFISTIMDQNVKLDRPARVVINERTGTIVAGGGVTIGNALVSHGSVQVRTQVTPYISQPPPFSNGKTQTVPVPEVGIREESAQNFVTEKNTDVQQLANALDSLGLNPRDIISIFQALDKAGALHGELIVM